MERSRKSPSKLRTAKQRRGIADTMPQGSKLAYGKRNRANRFGSKQRWAGVLWRCRGPTLR